MQALLLSLFLAGEALALPPYAEQPVAVEEDPFQWEVAPAILVAGMPQRLPLTLVVPDGHHVYRDMLEVEVTLAGSLEVLAVHIPEGEVGADPAQGGGLRPQFDDDVTVEVELRAPADFRGGVPVTIRTRHQGCKVGLCYPPVDGAHRVPVAVRGPGDETAGAR